MKCIQFNDESKYIKEFIKLPKKLYIGDNTEDSKEVKEILEGIHPLCKYFTIYKFIIVDREETVGRFAITVYPNDDNAYLGFFECYNDKEIAKTIFDSAKKFVRENNYKSIIGPVDASFWFKYRLKINKFDKKPYTGEPYNKDYYYKMFLDNGFDVAEHYTSNTYKVIEDEYKNEKYLSRYNKYTNEGIVIKNLNGDEYDKEMEKLYFLLTDLYKDFPIYKSITKEDFVNMFKSYKMILNPSMVKLAYKGNELVGFFISIPNYSNLVYNLNILKIFKVLKLKRKPTEYIMLYVGVAKEYPGLGTGISYTIINELKKNKLPSIGALTKDRKATQNYASDLLTDRYEYVLMQFNL